MTPQYIYKATCVRIVDGDTFVARVQLGFFASIQINVRLHGVDTPERNEFGNAEATTFLRELLGEGQEAKPLVLQTFKDRQSFTRWVSDVWILNDEQPVSEKVIESGHGVEYTV